MCCRCYALFVSRPSSDSGHFVYRKRARRKQVHAQNSYSLHHLNPARYLYVGTALALLLSRVSASAGSRRRSHSASCQANSRARGGSVARCGGGTCRDMRRREVCGDVIREEPVEDVLHLLQLCDRHQHRVHCWLRCRDRRFPAAHISVTNT